jgi:hypothetical protein
MMPTTYRPELNHKHFEWSRAFREISTGLAACRERILDVIGFYDEYGDPSEWTEADKANAEFEKENVIEEIAVILANSAAIAVTAGFKPPNRVIATLRAISRTPDLVRKNPDLVEPEALGVIAAHYDRGDGVGKHPFDILGHPGRIRASRTEAKGSRLKELDRERHRAITTYRQKRASNVDGVNERSSAPNSGETRVARRPKPSLAAVKAAIERGIAALEATARPARRARLDLEVLAGELASLFRRYSGVLVTRIVDPQRAEDEAPLERGRFKDFLALVLPPLEGVLGQYPNVPHRISRDSLVRRAIKLQNARRRSSPVLTPIPN